ncbi:hypothetical protein ACLOJK_025078 [Asimina triloba]
MKNSKKKKAVCWGCGQSGHVKKIYPRAGVNSASGSKSVNGDADSLILGVNLCQADANVANGAAMEEDKEGGVAGKLRITHGK